MNLLQRLRATSFTFGATMVVFAIVACSLPGLFLGLMLGYRTFRALATFAGFGWFITMAVLPYFIAAVRPSAGTVLFLRRFGLERPPAFPVSRIIARLTTFGYDVVTLADELINVDRESYSIPITLIAGITGAFATFVPCTFLMFCGIFASIAVSQGGNQTIGVAIFVVGFAAPPLLTFVIPLRGQTLHSRITAAFEGAYATIFANVMPLRTDMRMLDDEQIHAALTNALGYKWQLGIKVVAASDANWESIVSVLLKRVTHVLVDISCPSDSLIIEVALLAGHLPPERIVWLHGEHTVLPATMLEGGGYEMFGHEFRGELKHYRYPEYADGELIDPKRAGSFTDLGLLNRAERIRALLA